MSASCVLGGVFPARRTPQGWGVARSCRAHAAEKARARTLSYSTTYYLRDQVLEIETLKSHCEQVHTGSSVEPHPCGKRPHFAAFIKLYGDPLSSRQRAPREVSSITIPRRPHVASCTDSFVHVPNDAPRIVPPTRVHILPCAHGVASTRLFALAVAPP